MNAAKPDFPKDGFAIRLYISEFLSATLWLGDFVAEKKSHICGTRSRKHNGFTKEKRSKNLNLIFVSKSASL